MTRFIFTDPSGATNIAVVIKTDIIGFNNNGNNNFTPRNGLIMDVQGLASDTNGLFAGISYSGPRLLPGTPVQTTDLIAFAALVNLELTALEEGNVANTPVVLQEQTLGTPDSFIATPTSTTEVDLSWAAVANATTYKLERATNSGFSAGLTTLQNTSTLTFSDTGRTTGTVYYYRVSASATGEITSGYALATQGPLLAAPDSFAATPGATDNALAWTLPTGATGVTVDAATNVGFTAGVRLGIYSGNGTSFDDTGLTGSTEYFYRIKAIAPNLGTSAYATCNGTTS